MHQLIVNFELAWRKASSTRRVGMVIVVLAFSLLFVLAWTVFINPNALSASNQADLVFGLMGLMALGIMFYRLGG